jgi:transposase-like protein
MKPETRVEIAVDEATAELLKSSAHREIKGELVIRMAKPWDGDDPLSGMLHGELLLRQAASRGHCHVEGSLAGKGRLSQDGEMTAEPATYPGYRFPAEVIRHAVWLYHLFSLSSQDVELLFAERGLAVSHESIRRWCLRFGADFAAKLRKRRPKPGDTWHMDEVYLKINGELFYLWRAVDQHGVVLDILVQKRRNGTAATRFFKRLLVGLEYKPRKIVTDGLRSHGVARREVLPEVRHRSSRYLTDVFDKTFPMRPC